MMSDKKDKIKNKLYTIATTSGNGQAAVPQLYL